MDPNRLTDTVVMGSIKMNTLMPSLFLILICTTGCGCVRTGKHTPSSNSYFDLRPKESQAHSEARKEYEEQKFSTPSWAHPDRNFEETNETDDYLEDYKESHRLH